MSLAGLIRVARGQDPADLILTNARIVNTFTAEIEEGDVAVFGGRIAGVGKGYQGTEVIDLEGRYLAPGLIDGHTHLESSMLHVAQYVRAVVPHGTTSAITDLHEIANVLGLVGARYIMDAARRLPFDLFFMAPSCVPATPMETAGAELSAQDIKRALHWKGVLGVGEMMNFPGVINAFPDVLDKIGAAAGRLVDGHAPGLSGKDLAAYVAAGIRSDHESTRYEEGLEKLRRGMYLMIREGSSEKNLEDLLPLVNDGTYRRCLLVVDDRNAVDLLEDGDMDAVVRKAIRLGLDPVRAIQLATINPAEYFRLDGLGAVGPGYWASLIVLGDLKDFDVQMVFHRGRLVAQEGKPLFAASFIVNPRVTHTMNVRPFGVAALALRARGETLPIIVAIPGQIVTGRTDEKVKVQNGFVLPDGERDHLKLAVVERHKATGNIGLSLVKGFGLKRGALASSVAHDSHNIVAVGVSDQDIYVAVKEVERLGGGLVVAAERKVLGALPLPIAGLLSDKPLEEVAATLKELHRLALELGCVLPSPFATLSFMALPVIPELKLTDKGLVDVTRFEFVG